MDQPLKVVIFKFSISLQWLFSEHLIIYQPFLTVCSLMHLIHNLKKACRQTIISMQCLGWELLAKYLLKLQSKKFSKKHSELHYFQSKSNDRNMFAFKYRGIKFHINFKKKINDRNRWTIYSNFSIRKVTNLEICRHLEIFILRKWLNLNGLSTNQ